MNVLKLIGAIFSLVSIVLLGAGGYTYQHTKKFVGNSAVAKGVVVDVVSRSSSSSSGHTHVPVVRFKTDEGETITAHGSLGSDPPSYKKGQEVKVRYDPKDPTIFLSTRSLNYGFCPLFYWEWGPSSG